MPTLHWGHRTCPAPRHTGQMCLTCDVGVLVPLVGLWEEPTLFGPFSELSPRFGQVGEGHGMRVRPLHTVQKRSS